MILREVESKIGVISRLEKCFSDYRHASYVEHPLGELLRQRILGLALGYEDLNDHDRLRVDAVLAGKPDVIGEYRTHEADRGNALAAHSTLNRLDLGADHLDVCYKKIEAHRDQIEELLIGPQRSAGEASG